MGVMSLAGFISLLAATVLGVRFARRRPFLIVPGVLIGFSGFGSFLLTDSTMLYVAIVALGFSTWFYLPGLMTIPMDLYPDDPRRIALIFGTLMAFGGIASFAVPWVVGVITDITGSFLPGLFLFAILSWSLLVSGILLPETGSSIKRLIEQSKRTPPNTL
jgi:MFS family permease